MTRYLTLEEVLELHRLALEQSGGLDGVRDLGGLESAIAQPQMTFGGQDLYPSLAERAAAMCYSLVCNHSFVDDARLLQVRPARQLRLELGLQIRGGWALRGITTNPIRPNRGEICTPGGE